MDDKRRERELYLRRNYESHLNVIEKDEFKDPVRSNLKPITNADIAEVQMDLVVLSQGRDMYEVF